MGWIDTPFTVAEELICNPQFVLRREKMRLGGLTWPLLERNVGLEAPCYATPGRWEAGAANPGLTPRRWGSVTPASGCTIRLLWPSAEADAMTRSPPDGEF